MQSCKRRAPIQCSSSLNTSSTSRLKVVDLERLSVDMNFKLIIMRVKDHHSAQTDISLR